MFRCMINSELYVNSGNFKLCFPVLAVIELIIIFNQRPKQEITTKRGLTGSILIFRKKHVSLQGASNSYFNKLI